MKNVLRISASILGVALLVILYQSFSNNTPQKSTAVYSNGVEGDRNARMEYEYNMLVDPATGKVPEHFREKELQTARALTQKFALQKNSRLDPWIKPWTSSGPANIGGRTRAMAYDVRNEDIILAAGASSGMMRSTDGGQSWEKVSSNDSRHSVTYVVQDTRDGKEDTWYYGTGEALGNSASEPGSAYRGTGIYKSTDNGLTWDQLTSTAPSDPYSLSSNFQFVFRIDVDESTPHMDVVYAACVGAVFKSIDGGESWTKLKGRLGQDMSESTDVYVDNTGAVYATMSSIAVNGNTSLDGNFYHAPAGSTLLEDITPDEYPMKFGRVVMEPANDVDGTIYFLGYTPNEDEGSEHKFYKNVNMVWTDLTDNLIGTGDYAYDSQEGYDICIVVNPNNASEVYIGGTCLYRSKTAFTTPDSEVIGGYDFDIEPLPLIEGSWVDYHRLVFSKDEPNKLMVGCDGGVRYIGDVTADPLVWNELNTTYTTSQFYSAAIDKKIGVPKITMTGGLQDRGSYIATLGEGPVDWDALPLAGDGGVTKIPDGAEVVYASNQYGELYQVNLTVDPPIAVPIAPKNASADLFISPYELDPVDNKTMYYVAGKEIWLYTDLKPFTLDDTTMIQNNWKKLDNLTAESNITAISAAQDFKHTLYFGTEDGKFYYVFDPTQGTPFPIDKTSELFPEDGYISDIALDPVHFFNVMVTFSNYNVNSIFYTSDGGDNWQHIGGDLDDENNFRPSIRSAQIIRDDLAKPFYLVGSSIGIFMTDKLTDDPVIWYPQGQDVTGYAVISDFDSRADGHVIAATHGNGVYQAKIKGFVNLDEYDNSNPFNASVYPNPVIGSTAYLKLNVNNPTTLKTYMYDLQGRMVQQPVEHSLATGENTVNIDMQHLTQGAYYLIMEAEDTKQSMRLLK